MSRINIHRGTFLEKEELTRMIRFLDEKPDTMALFSASVSFGLVSPQGIPGGPFKVTTSTGALGSVNIVGGYVIDSNLRAYKVNNHVDFPIPNDSKYYWMKVRYVQHSYEEGYVQVDSSGNVSGTVSFTGIVRGQSSGVPSCIRFVKDDGSQPLNSGVYQVVDIVNNNNIILSGGTVFKAESDLRVVVLGSIPMGRRFTDEQLEGLYTFDTYEIVLVEEPSSGTEPVKEDNEYYIARVRNNGGSVTVLDERTEFWALVGGGSGKTYTVTIVPTPAQSQVMLNGITRSTMQALDGTTVIWSVSCPGYITKTGSLVVDGNDVEMAIELSEDSGGAGKVTITVQTEDGSTSQGFVSINNQIVIDKANDSIAVDLGTSVQICAKPNEGYAFREWTKNGVTFNSELIQDVIADNDAVYVAKFRPATEVDYWDFEVKTGEGGYDVFSVPTASGTGEYEGLSVKVK